jgi:hypothetical protein
MLDMVWMTRSEERAQILDIYGTLVADTCVVDLHIGPIGDCRAVATLCDPQAMDVELGDFGNLLIDLCCGSIGAHIDGLWEVSDRAA